MPSVLDIPRITFGIIVLNGEPFTRYNLRALYPFAHQIIVVEGASFRAAHVATSDGHSIDNTLEVLCRFKREEDPDDKITIVTAEDAGYPNGFWPGEKDEQSQAYAKRATGDWLWQVDIDEFYRPEDMQRVCEYILAHPDTTCLTFNAYHFWGGFDYLVEGGLFMSHRFQGERWGAYRRVFRWEPGYRYASHRPPTVRDALGKDITGDKKYNLSRLPSFAPVYMYHYTNLFPTQVIPKGAYYANQDWVVGLTQRKNFESFLAPVDENRATRIYDHYGTYNWLRLFSGQHPPTILVLRSDLQRGYFTLEMRRVDDIELVLGSAKYNRKVRLLYKIEWLRTCIFYINDSVVFLLKKAIAKLVRFWFPPTLISILPKGWQVRISRQRSVMR
jgi:hypothetical protein